jgi:ribosomal protection tetracycline resistance protein
LCIERLIGVGEAVELIAVEPNPFLATVGLRLQPAAIGSGICFDLEVELGSMPRAFFEAIESTARESLREGLAGWPVPDCRITVIRCGYWPRQSHAHATFDKSMSSTGRDFRQLTPLVTMDALHRARTQVAEPVHRFDLEIPESSVTAILRLLDQAEAAVESQVLDGSVARLAGTLPAARVHRLRQELPARTSGEGLLDTRFDHYAPVRGATPRRSRTEPDPMNRKEYLLRVARRSLAG